MIGSIPEALTSYDQAEEALAGAHGVLVPGGFGPRGVEGKILAAQYAREHKTPFLGLCLGMQCAVIEFARNVCGLHGANSTEFDAAAVHPVIDFMPEQRGIERIGGTMRLGVYPCALEPGRRRPWPMVKPWYMRGIATVTSSTTRISASSPNTVLGFPGLSPQRSLIEIVELSDHPWFVGHAVPP